MKVTQKELDETDKKIIQFISEGMSYRELADNVFVSVATIKYRIRAMKNKYHCKTTPQLISKIGKANGNG